MRSGKGGDTIDAAPEPCGILSENVRGGERESVRDVAGENAAIDARQQGDGELEASAEDGLMLGRVVGVFSEGSISDSRDRCDGEFTDSHPSGNTVRRIGVGRGERSRDELR